MLHCRVIRSCLVICLFTTGAILPSANTLAAEAAPNRSFAVDPVFDSRTYIEEWGDPANPPVILVHGLGDNGARDWRYLAPALAEDFYVVAFDLPGFGRSEKYNALYTPETYTRFVEWIAETYVEGQFTLIGHSMGGAIALNYAAAHADRLTRLVLIDAAGILHRTAFTKHLINNVKLPDASDTLPADNLAALNELLGINLEDIDRYPAAMDVVLLSPIVRGALLGGDSRAIAGFALVQHNFSGKLRKVTVPTLVIWGAEDPVTPLRTGRLLASNLPMARLEIVQGAGHTPMVESTARLNRLVLDELDSSVDRYGAEPAQPTFAETAESQACNGENNRYISGRYKRVTIENCDGLLIENSRIERLIVRNSSVEILTSEIGGGTIAVEVENSVLMATATTFTAETPVVLSGSRLDFAGVEIIAGEKPFEADARSTVLFSVSTVRTPAYSRYAHGIYYLSHEQQPF
jgi:pimeloyl-ACP methyl ester carboxylesterase